LPALVAEARTLLARHAASAYPEVINATGVLIHTNLGRAPRLGVDASGYLALEYDLSSGTRGERLAPVVERLTRYFGAEAATVVTNNAAALVLLLAAHAAGRNVIVSRGELIEIGGSFRLPEIMAASTARTSISRGSWPRPIWVGWSNWGEPGVCRSGWTKVPDATST
jgi:L-seryl-tRNA(Ser) seleniumtransferase